jgi:hypothetical protein
MDAQELQKLKGMAQAATPGPWRKGSGRTVGPVSQEDDQSFGMVISLADIYGDRAEDDTAFIAAANPAAVLELIEIAERAVSPAESVDTPEGNWPKDFREIIKAAEDAAHAEGRRSAMEELPELKREKERRDRIVQRAVARLNAAEVEEPSVIGAGFADPALPIEELYPQWLKEKERADKAEADAALWAKRYSDALNAAAQQVPNLSKLERLNIDADGDDIQEIPYPDGDFVRFADVQALLAQPLQQEGGKDERAMFETEIVKHFAFDPGLFKQFDGNTYFSDPLTFAHIGWKAARALAHPSDKLQQASTAQVEPIEDPVTVPRGLLGAACHAIERKKDAPTVLAKLREFTTGTRSGYRAAPAQATMSVAFSQFLTDVMTAAGLLSHGKRDKALAARLGAECMKIRSGTIPAAQATPEGADLRNDFEMWKSRRGEAAIYAGDGQYESSIVQGEWEAWCDSAELYLEA